MKIFRRTIVWILILLPVTISAALTIFPLSEESIRLPPASIEVLARDGTVLRVISNDQGEISLPCNFEDLGDWLPAAIIAAEDKRFFRHPGIDLCAITRALVGNIKNGRIVSGASTLSSLVIKLASGRNDRGWGTKLTEFARAFQLEQKLGKKEILEQFFNRAPFGGNIIGVRTAARIYFGRDPSALSLGEAALLAGLPQAPARLRPDRHPAAAKKRRDWVINRMKKLNMISPELAQKTQKTQVQINRKNLPFSAPHFCDSLPTDLLIPGTLKTTLSPRIQSLAEAVVRENCQRLKTRGSSGGAAVVIHVPTGEVRALVGSPDYFAPRDGQVNCAQARRSPGSALKPFLYCLAFDLGLATPGTRLRDTPYDREGYSPRNYEHTYSGKVSARQALVRSLNLPAIRLCSKIGPNKLADTFRKCGMRSIDRKGDHYGLTLAVGGCETTLLEITNAAAILGRGGSFLPARMTFSIPEVPVKVFSPEACWMVNEILSPPFHPFPKAQDKIQPWFAWKTGTSTGHRDAWTIAWNNEYAVGTWFGNPDGKGTEVLVGVTAAAPATIRIMSKLTHISSCPPQPMHCQAREICSLSGLIAGPDCSGRDREYYIPGISPSLYCPGAKFSPKDPNPGSILITSPLEGQTIRLLPEHESLLSLQAKTPPGEKRPCYWFVDGVPMGTTIKGETLSWTPSSGQHLICCSLPDGKADSVRITVETYQAQN